MVPLAAGSDGLRRAASGGDTSSPAAGSISLYFSKSQFCARLSAVVPSHVRHHDPPSLLQTSSRQAPNGLGMTAIAAGFSLLPLSAAALRLRGGRRLGLRAAVGVRRMMGGRIAAARAGLRDRLGIPCGGRRFTRLMLGLLRVRRPASRCPMPRPRGSASRRWPASRGRQGPPAVLNACSFLGGTVGVTCGGAADHLAGFRRRAPAGGALRADRRGALSAAAPRVDMSLAGRRAA